MQIVQQIYLRAWQQPDKANKIQGLKSKKNNVIKSTTDVTDQEVILKNKRNTVQTRSTKTTNYGQRRVKKSNFK
jgi:hypothetical protein